MTLPMILLAIGSLGAGAALATGGRLVNWLEPVVGVHHGHLGIPVWVMTAITLSVVVVGAGLAYRMYGRRPVERSAPSEVSALTVAARRDLYGDAFNEAVFMRPGQRLTAGLVRVDTDDVDGLGTGLAALVAATSNGLRRLQTGFVRSYALSMLAGAALIVALIMAVNLW